MAHVRQELALRAGGGFRGIARPAQLLVTFAAVGNVAENAAKK
jgi:hypothetical protein